jgi:RNA polymerase sigma-70 factor (ECF subfamily)
LATFHLASIGMDRSELERELERLHPESFGWALCCSGRDRDQAQDVLQEAYARVVSGAARFEGRSAFRTWLFGVIRRTALAERRRARRPNAPPSETVLADPTPGADEQLQEAERREELLLALDALSPRQREVLVLVFYHELTVEEAAQVMEISLGSARTHYDRGKKGLRLRLSPQEVRR